MLALIVLLPGAHAIVLRIVVGQHRRRIAWLLGRVAHGTHHKLLLVSQSGIGSVLQLPEGLLQHLVLLLFSLLLVVLRGRVH